MNRPVMFYVNSTCPALDLTQLSIVKITSDSTAYFAVVNDGSSYQINETINAFWTRYNSVRANASAIVF